MILYTPMQLELVLEGFDTTEYPVQQEALYGGVPVLLEYTAGGKKKIAKLLSTNPYDYLRPDLYPGKIIES